MYQMIVVDDEISIQEEFRRLDVSHMGIHLLGVYGDGLSAYQAFRDNRIDILITDIKMPIMTGLELIEKVRREYPYTHIIVLSGYDDYSYLRQCMKMNTTDYLLKPMNIQELKALLLEIVRKLQYTHSEQHARLEERKQRLAAKLIRKKFFESALTRPMKHEELEENLIYCEISFDNVYSVFCLQVNREKKYYNEKEWKLLLFGIEKILDEYIEDNSYGYVWLDQVSGNAYCILTDLNIQDSTEKIKVMLHKMTEKLNVLRGLLRATISYGVVFRVTSIDCLSRYAALAHNIVRQFEDITFASPEEILRCTADVDLPDEQEMDAVDCPSAFIRQAIGYIKKNYTMPITLEDVAKQIHVNPTYLSRLFKEKAGIRFVDYLTDHRIRKAKYLLNNTSMLIQEISEKVGYENARYFSYIFKKKTGLTPHEYRNQLDNESW